MLVDDDGHPCLADFGQSHASDSGKFLDSTRVGLAYNPLPWMAPEVMAGGECTKASDKSDIYSFGCVLYEVRWNSLGPTFVDVYLIVTRWSLAKSRLKIYPLPRW